MDGFSTGRSGDPARLITSVEAGSIPAPVTNFGSGEHGQSLHARNVDALGQSNDARGSTQTRLPEMGAGPLPNLSAGMTATDASAPRMAQPANLPASKTYSESPVRHALVHESVSVSMPNRQNQPGRDNCASHGYGPAVTGRRDGHSLTANSTKGEV